MLEIGKFPFRFLRDPIITIHPYVIEIVCDILQKMHALLCSVKQKVPKEI